ncbi:MAG: hypothetical protein DU429_08120 [Candidatus Tokpelaia sp.]|nr:MAG: hypothetical protein DU430_08450 [Candidatus Tokpelaia sp.]KAA6205404.1 MAG: hypothetical protein DU429_08120 [Candidatus Tokpelaia sp.]
MFHRLLPLKLLCLPVSCLWRKSPITKAFGLSGAVLASWLHGFNFVRNIAAHHARLWNSAIAVPVTIPKTLSNLSRLDNRRPFLYFCLIQFIIKQSEKERLGLPPCNWGEKFKNLPAIFLHIANQAVTLSDMGCIADWGKWDLRQ